MTYRPLRLRLDGDALAANWRWLAARSGPASCGAAVKANAYGLGAPEVVSRLSAAGCQDFFVATWAEAEALGKLPDGVGLSVLHGLFAEDMPVAAVSSARPVLNTPAQIALWRQTGRPCDVMIDTGMNRLGVAPSDIRGGLLDGLVIDTILSHFASADEDAPTNAAQRALFDAAIADIPARRRSLANSAALCADPSTAYDLTRPGVALYGGIVRSEAAGHIAGVVRLEARVLQRRTVPAGQTVGYNGTWTATTPTEVAVLNIGYADGYLRGFSSRGQAFQDGIALPVLGRVSMDLTAIRVDAAPHIAEGDWVEIDFDLPRAAQQSGLSQYELLTTLGRRHERIWS